MKILYMNTLNLNVAYYRIENPAQTLVKLAKKNGDIVHVEYFVHPDGPHTWEGIMYSGTKDAEVIYESIKSAFSFFDIIVVQRLGRMDTVNYFNRLKKECNTKLFLEIDDSLDKSSQTALKINSNTIVQSNMALATICDGIICSTDYLANSMKKYNKNTYVFNNFIATKNWDFKQKPKQKDKWRLGYLAASGHDHDLEAVWPELMEFIESDQNNELVIRYGGYIPDFMPKDHPQVDYKNLSCHISQYPQKYEDLQLNCSIAPLRDLEFNRCKSEIKVLEAFTHRIPIVASDMEVYNNKKVRKLLGKGLYLANRGHWVEKLQEAKDTEIIIGKEYSRKLYSPMTMAKDFREWLSVNNKFKYDEPIFSGEKYSFKI